MFLGEQSVSSHLTNDGEDDQGAAHKEQDEQAGESAIDIPGGVCDKRSNHSGNHPEKPKSTAPIGHGIVVPWVSARCRYLAPQSHAAPLSGSNIQ